MHLAKRTIFIGGGLLVAVMALMLVFSTGNSSQTEAGGPAPAEGFVCFDAPGGPLGGLRDIDTDDNFNNDGTHNLGPGETYCEPVVKDDKILPANTATPPANAPIEPERLRCFEVTDGDDAALAVDVTTQFHQPKLVEVQKLQRLCIPASNDGSPGVNDAATYACFDVKGVTADEIQNADRHLSTAKDKLNVTVLGSDQLCMPATVKAIPIPTPPLGTKLPGPQPLLCYDINASKGGNRVETVTSNVGIEVDLDIFDAEQLCVPAVVEKKALEGSGNLSGIALINVIAGDGVAFYCRARTDHDSATNEIKTAATCFSDQAPILVNLPGNKIPDDPNLDFAGPPPPPPYGNGAPQKGEGSWCGQKPDPTPTVGPTKTTAPTKTPVPTTELTPGPTKTPVPPQTPTQNVCVDPLSGLSMKYDDLISSTCFASLGGTLGPNIIAVLTVPNAKATLPNQSGSVTLYYGQSIADCKALVPSGPAFGTLDITIDTYDTPPYSNGAPENSVDSDGDGCADAFELDKSRAKKDCGKDPWNPHDSDLDFSGVFTITVEVIRADTCPGTAGPPPIGCDGAAAGDTVAGSYFNCQAFLDHDKGDNSITGKALCYTDNPVTTVNMEDNLGAIVCAPFPSVNPEDCGDGLPGAPPPGPFTDNDGETTPGVITGFLDKDKNKIFLTVCFQGIFNPAIGPNAYAQIELDAHTMLGTVDIWLQQQVFCVKPTSDPGSKAVGVALGEQDDDYDVDQDGCNVREELDVAVFGGGQRDPYNKYDHMDINKDGFINIPDDILGTAAMFGPIVKGVQGNVGPRLVGSVPWAHSNGDTAINIPDDILGVASQFGHNCDGSPGTT